MGVIKRARNMVSQISGWENEFATHTFSECVENHAGMETIGKKLPSGFSEGYLLEISERTGAELHTLRYGKACARVIIFRSNSSTGILSKKAADALWEESRQKPFDSTYLNTRRKLVQKKHGRMNNCYADEAQKPDIPAGKGTVVAFSSAPHMAALRKRLPDYLGEQARNLFAETNLYTDVRNKKVGIGFHGDSERSIVVGVRLGRASLPLRFQWYNRGKAVSNEHAIELAHGDVYAMSWKATGHNWRSPSQDTLRHGVGFKAKSRAIGK